MNSVTSGYKSMRKKPTVYQQELLTIVYNWKNVYSGSILALLQMFCMESGLEEIDTKTKPITKKVSLSWVFAETFSLNSITVCHIFMLHQ